MAHLTVSQRTFLVQRYLETKDCNIVLAEFARQFPGRNAPSKATITKNVHKFLTHGTMRNLHKERCGRRRSTRTDQNIQAVRDEIQQNNRVTCRRNNLGLSSASFNRIMRLDLRFHPYKMHKRHALKQADFARRMRYAQWFLNSCQNNRFLANIVVGDEAAFGMDGEVSSQNVRCYAERGHPPNVANFDVNYTRQKVHVWAGLCGNGTLLGPYFFERNVNGRTYLDMLNTNVFPQLQRNFNNIPLLHNLNALWWVQDGATPHRTNPVRDRIRQVFGRRVIAMGHEHEWPARSPDLTPCDFFLWGWLKQKVYVTPPQNVDDLRRRIVDAANSLTPQMITNSIRAMETRARMCVNNGGQHVEGN